MSEEEIVEARNRLAALSNQQLLALWENLTEADAVADLVAGEIERRDLDI